MKSDSDFCKITSAAKWKYIIKWQELEVGRLVRVYSTLVLSAKFGELWVVVSVKGEPRGGGQWEKEIKDDSQMIELTPTSAGK